MIETYLKEEEINGMKVFKTYTNIANLKPSPTNPKDISEENLGDLIEFIDKYNALAPVLVDVRPEHEGELLGGNQRLKAYHRLAYQEVWIELRLPESDAAAFEIAMLHNMEFGAYLEMQLKEQTRRFKDELNLDKLTVNLSKLNTLDDLLKPNRETKPKYEIIIKCIDETDLSQKLSKLSEVGISAKTKR